LGPTCGGKPKTWWPTAWKRFGAFETCADDPVLRARPADLLGALRFGLEASFAGATPEQIALYLHPAVARRTVAISAAAMEELRQASPTTMALVDMALPQLFVLQPVSHRGAGGSVLHAVRLVPRPR
jgi:hypothetical protein